MNESPDLRALVFASGRDGCLTREILTEADVACEVVYSADSLCHEIETGAGVLILAEETLTLPNVIRIAGCLEQQPPWSDLPVIVVAGNGGRVGRALKPLDVMRNVAVLPRPLPIDTLVTAVRSALRARGRQYEVRKLLREREEADRRKDEFLAMLAHELRNPLAPIRSAVHILRVIDVPDPNVTEVRDVLDRQVGHMARLIDDLLDVSRISRGKVELRKQILDLGQAATQAADVAKSLMEAKGHRFSIELPDTAIVIEADPTRLEQVIGNLLNNAAKYTEPGGQVTLSVGREATSAVVRVRDTGVGIDSHVLPRVFDLFAQADRSLDRTQGGLGIGLTVVKSLVDLHGGTVEAHSAGLGQGTEIVLRFPVVTDAATNGQTSDRSPSSGARRLHVLVVEDNRDAARMLAAVCRLRGHDVRIAYDGPAALAAVRDFEPDIILSDIGLPGIDGYGLAAMLRREPTCRNALLVAVTGYGQVEDVSKARAAGFDHHLTKPLDIARLDSILGAIRPGDPALTTFQRAAGACDSPRRQNLGAPNRCEASAETRASCDPLPPGEGGRAAAG